jgi:hypothetical protein
MQLESRGDSIVLYETKNLQPVEHERQSGLIMEGATDDQNSFILCWQMRYFLAISKATFQNHFSDMDKFRC